MSKNLDETVRLQSEKRQEWIREIRGERSYKRLQRAQVALPVWPAHQPCRSPGETGVRGLIAAIVWDRGKTMNKELNLAKQTQLGSF